MSRTCRLDKWLWAVRIYKTRSQATAACQAGKIKRQNKSLKPSATLQIGDHLDVTTPDNSHVRHLEVLQLLHKRVSASLAREAFADHTSQDILDAVAEKRKIQREDRLFRQDGDQGRMTKKKRRDWDKHLPFFGED
ncbi:MAG: S4 domain-containing protein [Verrucomicrobiota bacterium]